jgi:outer membrane protein OmpA-like peptidoglycan-associated protein/tetratricopeptide (TPR) repeat protein
VWDNYKVETLRKLLIVFVAVFGWHQGLAQVSILSTNTPKGIYAIKGDYYFEHNNYVKAVENYSISTNKNDTHLMLRMAEAYQKLGNEELAIHWHNKAISINPESELINSSKDKSEAVLLKPEGLSVYCSNGDVIELSDSGAGNLVFDFIPGISYWLIINYDNYKDESQVRLLNKIKILKSDNYTFHIQKLVEAASEQSEGSKRLQDFHVNPGDLITFQLIPNPSLNSDLIDSRIRFKDKDATINSNDTLVFSYVAEEISKTSGINNTATNDELNEVSEDILALDDKASDTISMTEPILPALTELQKEDKKEEDIPLNVNPEEVALQDEPKVINQVLDDIIVNDSIEYSTPMVASNTTITEHDEDQKEEDIPLNVNLEEVALQDEPKVIDQVGDDITVNDSIEYSTPMVASNTMLIEQDEDKKEDDTSLNVNPEEVALQDEPKMIDQVGDDMMVIDSTEYSTPVVATNPTLIEHDQDQNKDDTSLSVNPEEVALQDEPKVIDQVLDDIMVNDSTEYSTPMVATNPTLIEEEDQNEDDTSLSVNPEEVALQEEPKVIDQVLDDITVNDSSEYSTPMVATNPTLTEHDEDENKDDDIPLNTNLEEVALQDEPKVIDQVGDDMITDDITNESSTPLIATDPLKGQERIVAMKEISDSKLETDSESIIDSSQPQRSDDHLITGEEESIDFLYRVQIAASRNKMSDAQLKRIYKGFKTISSFEEEGYYKYYIAETPSYPAARQTLKECGVDDAFIAVYKKNVKWKLQDVLAYQKKEPVERVPNTTVNSEPNKSKNDPNLLLVKNEVKTSDKTTLNPDPVAEKTLPPSGIVSKLNNEELDQENEEELSNVSKSQNATLLTETAHSEYTPLSNKEDTTDDPITLSDSDVEMAPKDKPNDVDQVTDERNNDFLYRVQIAAVKTKISDVKLNSLHGDSDKINYVKEDGYYKYNIAETPSYFVARQVLEKSNVKNAFIVAYKGDEKLKVEDAIAIQYKKPTEKSELAKSDSVLKIETVNFEFNEFTLPPKEMLYLRKNVIDPLKANKSYYAIVNGYTDIRGSEEYNYGLSQERALFVYKAIISEGISSERVKTQFFGESQLIKFCSGNDDCDESVHQANRRAEVLLLISKQ